MIYDFELEGKKINLNLRCKFGFAHQVAMIQQQIEFDC